MAKQDEIPLIPQPLIESYIRDRRAANRSEDTLKLYTFTLRLWAEWCAVRGVEVEDAKRRDVQEWLVSHQEAGLSASSIATYYRNLRAFYNWLEREGDIDRSPMKGMTAPTIPEKAKDVVAVPDLQKIFTSLERDKRWKELAILSIFYDTGMRVSELARVTRDAVNMTTGVVTLEVTKGRRARYVRLSPTSLRNVDRYLRRRKDTWPALIAGRKGAATRSGLYNLVCSVFTEHGFGTRISPHDLRHTSATHLTATGEVSESSIMALFGWTNAGMARHYAQQALAQRALDDHARFGPMEKLGRG